MAEKQNKTSVVLCKGCGGRRCPEISLEPDGSFVLWDEDQSAPGRVVLTAEQAALLADWLFPRVQGFESPPASKVLEGEAEVCPTVNPAIGEFLYADQQGKLWCRTSDGQSSPVLVEDAVDRTFRQGNL